MSVLREKIIYFKIYLSLLHIYQKIESFKLQLNGFCLNSHILNV